MRRRYDDGPAGEFHLSDWTATVGAGEFHVMRFFR